jgi:sec-independent protein translocase protein TatA
MGIGVGKILLIVVIALLLFGAKKLPQLGKAAGDTLKEFKKATKGLTDDHEEPKKETK